MRAGRGDRKHRAFVLLVLVGGTLCVAALGLAAVNRLTMEGVRVLEAFTSMASIAVFAFMGGNAAEHWSKTKAPKHPAEGENTNMGA